MLMLMMCGGRRRSPTSCKAAISHAMECSQVPVRACVCAKQLWLSTVAALYAQSG
jgi:hypothetical protein